MAYDSYLRLGYFSTFHTIHVYHAHTPQQLHSLLHCTSSLRHHRGRGLRNSFIV